MAEIGRVVSSRVITNPKAEAPQTFPSSSSIGSNNQKQSCLQGCFAAFSSTPVVKPEKPGSMKNRRLTQRQMELRSNRRKDEEGRQTVRPVEVFDIGGGRKVRFAAVSQRGVYPDDPDKANQDAFDVQVPVVGANQRSCFFGVFDGHGPYGDDVSQYTRKNLVREFVSELKKGRGIDAALTRAHVEVNKRVNEDKSISTAESGTTAISAFICDGQIIVSNVGDSRAMLGCTAPGRNGLVGKALSSDQTPYRRDERERCKAAGAAVMTLDQLYKVKPMDACDFDVQLGEEIDDDGDPPRLFHPGCEYPGAAYTRSIGDFDAEPLGVHAEPEILRHQIAAEDRVLVVASDGIFEFITTQQVIDIAARYKDPLEASQALVSEAYREWCEKMTRTDDITCIVVYFEAA